MLQLKEAELSHGDVSAEAVWVEDPVTFREFNSSSQFLGEFPLSDTQYEDVEKLIGTDPKQTFNPKRPYDLLVLAYGKGGGKDLVASRLALYLVYLLECMSSPQEYLLGVHSNVPMHIINVAKKGRQAKKIFFTYFSNSLIRARWFIDRFDIKYNNQWRSRVIKRSRMRGVINVTEDGAKFPKHIEVLPETSENESMEGYNPVFFVLDEISGFTSVNDLIRAWKIFNTVRSSMASRATKTFRGFGMVISYPRQQEGDIILQLYNMTKEVDSRMCGNLTYPWLAKGMKNYSGEMFVFRHPRLDSYFGIDNVGIEIPIEMAGEFAIKYASDSITKYLCIPPPTAGGWLEYPERVHALVSPTNDPAHPRFRPRLFVTRDKITHTVDEDGTPVSYLGKELVSCNYTTQRDKYKIPRVAWLDSAEKYCDAVISIGHLEHRNIVTDEGIMSVETVVQDDEIVWRPDKDRGVRVSLWDVERWLTEIIPKHVRLVAVGQDYWNSAQIEEKLRTNKYRIAIEVYNLLLADYNLLKRHLYIGALDLIDGEAPGQLINLIDGGPRKKPQKKPNFFMDAADAVCGIVRLLAGRDKHGRKMTGRRATEGHPVGVTGGSVGIAAMPVMHGRSTMPVGISAGGAMMPRGSSFGQQGQPSYGQMAGPMQQNRPAIPKSITGR